MTDDITLPRAVVEKVLKILNRINTADDDRNFLTEDEAVCTTMSIDELDAALEQPQVDPCKGGSRSCCRTNALPQNHVPDAGNMVPEGWKLVPVESTVEMMDAGGAATRRCYQHLNKGEVMCSYVYRHMLDAAPQPPTTEQSSAVQPQGEQKPFTVLVRKHSWLDNQWEAAPRGFPDYGKQWADERVNVYTHPQPKREPLTDEEILKLAYPLRWDEVDDFEADRAINFAQIIERAHGIGGEA